MRLFRGIPKVFLLSWKDCGLGKILEEALVEGTTMLTIEMLGNKNGKNNTDLIFITTSKIKMGVPLFSRWQYYFQASAQTQFDPSSKTHDQSLKDQHLLLDVVTKLPK